MADCKLGRWHMGRVFLHAGLLVLLSLSVCAQTVGELLTNYTGVVTWNGGAGTVTFVTSGEIAFNKLNYEGSIWEVPSGVQRIVINSNVTVSGQFTFKNSGTYTIAGQNRYTSRIYGTPEQTWADNRGVSPIDFSAVLTANNTVTVSNLTSVDPKGYHVRGPSGGKVHMLACDFIDTRGGFSNHSDGYVGGGGSLVQDCYFETGDDVFKVYWGTTAYSDCIIRMVQNAVPIQFGWGNYGSGAVGNFTNLMILGNWGRGAERQIFDGSAGSYAKTINVTGCDIQNSTSTLVRLNDAGQNVSLNISQAFIQVKKHSTIDPSSSLADNICSGAPASTSYDCRLDVPALPIAPTGLVASAISTKAIGLQWSDIATNETQYSVERSSSGTGSWAEVGVLLGNKTTFEDATLTAGNIRFYRVRAYNTTGFSAYSSVTSATTFPPPSGMPTNVAALGVSSNQISLSWSEVAEGEAGLELQSGPTAAGPWGLLAQLPPDSNSFGHNGLMPNQTVYYRLRALFPDATTAWSATVTGTTLPTSPSPPGYTNVDYAMAAHRWRPATNPSPPALTAPINFGTASSLTWIWDDSSSTNADLTYTISRVSTNDPGGAEVFFFGAAVFKGEMTAMRLTMDVAKGSANIGTLRFALRQGTNLFYTSAGVNNLPNLAGPMVNYELNGLEGMTLLTNGNLLASGLNWVSQHAGTSPDFTNGLPVEFGIRCDAALGAAALTSDRGPVLANFTVQIEGVNQGVPPLLAISNEGPLVISWTAIPGLAYSLEGNTNLAVDAWQPVGGSYIATDTVLNATNATTLPRFFYRVRLGGL